MKNNFSKNKKIKIDNSEFLLRSSSVHIFLLTFFLLISFFSRIGFGIEIKDSIEYNLKENDIILKFNTDVQARCNAVFLNNVFESKTNNGLDHQIVISFFDFREDELKKINVNEKFDEEKITIVCFKEDKLSESTRTTFQLTDILNFDKFLVIVDNIKKENELSRINSLDQESQSFENQESRENTSSKKTFATNKQSDFFKDNLLFSIIFLIVVILVIVFLLSLKRKKNNLNIQNTDPKKVNETHNQNGYSERKDSRSTDNIDIQDYEEDNAKDKNKINTNFNFQKEEFKGNNTDKEKTSNDNTYNELRNKKISFDVFSKFEEDLEESNKNEDEVSSETKIQENNRENNRNTGNTNKRDPIDALIEMIKKDEFSNNPKILSIFEQIYNKNKIKELINLIKEKQEPEVNKKILKYLSNLKAQGKINPEELVDLIEFVLK